MKFLKNDGVLPFKHLGALPEFMNDGMIKNEKKIRMVEINSLQQYKRFMHDHTDFKAVNYNSSMREDGDSSWSGTSSWGDYLKLLDNGDDEIVKKIKLSTTKQVAEISKKYKDVLTNFKFDVTGQFFDIGLVLQGAPETWLDPVVDHEEVMKIDIILNGAFNSGVDKDKVIENASRILAMSRILEDHKIQVRIKMVMGISNYASDSETLITIMDIKGYDEPVNYQKISVMLSPTNLRRGHFKLAEVASPKLQSRYGYPFEVKEFTTLSDHKSVTLLEGRLFQ